MLIVMTWSVYSDDVDEMKRIQIWHKALVVTIVTTWCTEMTPSLHRDDVKHVQHS